jgi:hypothetical protein
MKILFSLKDNDTNHIIVADKDNLTYYLSIDLNKYNLSTFHYLTCDFVLYNKNTKIIFNKYELNIGKLLVETDINNHTFNLLKLDADTIRLLTRNCKRD